MAITGDLWGEACLDYWRTGDGPYDVLAPFLTSIVRSVRSAVE